MEYLIKPAIGGRRMFRADGSLVGVVRLRGNRAAVLDAGGALLATAEAAGGCLELRPAGGRPVLLLFIGGPQLHFGKQVL